MEETTVVHETLAQEEISLLAVGMPVVRCFLSSEKQLFLQCIIESSEDLSERSSDLLSPWLPQGVFLSALSIQRSVFFVDALQNRSFAFIDIKAHLDSSESVQALAENLSSFKRQITLFLRLPPLLQQIITTQPSSCQPLALPLRQEMLRWFSRYLPQNPSTVFSELQRLLLTTDDDFKKLRTPSHLLKLIRAHLYLKGKQPSFSSSHAPEKHLFYHIFQSKLHFPFGTKDVLCLVISLHSLSPYERFDDRHIILSCQRCLSSLEAVPRSFYVYSSPEGPALSFHIELEKKDGSLPTLAEMKILKRELGSELVSSIEQVMSRIDIPQNEEDLLRNLLLLSQQVRTLKDPPHIIVQFHGQTDISLAFHVTIVMSIREDAHVIPISANTTPNISRCILLRSSIVDKLRHGFVKQGVMFLVECSKEGFLRRDRSVDFLKARETVVHCIESTYGKVRDVNGGLIYQQHHLLASVQPLLTKEEGKELFLIEDIFHSLSPTMMKNILGPEHIVTLFRQLTALRTDLRQKVARPFIVEEYTKEIFIGFLCPEDFVKESLFLAIPQFHLDEKEFALCHVAAEGHWFCFVICINQDPEMRRHLLQWIQEKLNRSEEATSSRSFRMCLPRPTLILDPRIAADRTSGAVIKMLYEGLTRLDSDENPSLALAREVLISPNGKTYTFKLRPSFWSNGQPVTAHDFEYAWKKVLSPSFQTYFDFLFHPILNARLVKSGRLLADDLGVCAVNDHVLVVNLERPCPRFLELCALWIYSPLCKDIDNTYPGWAYYGEKNYVSNGPFILKQMSRTGAIHLEKNNRYWDKDRVFLEHIDISIIEDPATALQLFSNGELDLVGDPLSEISLQSMKKQGSKIHSRGMAAVHGYMLNTTHAPFRSAKVRHAFSQALPRQAIIEKFLYGDEHPAHSIFASPFSLLPSDTPFPYDRDNAKRLFEGGLDEQGLSASLLKPLKLVIYNHEPYKSIAKYVAATWEKAFGICINIELVSWKDFIDNHSSNSHDITGTVWYSWYRDPCYSLRMFSSSRSHFNASHWSSEAVRDLVDYAEEEREPDRRNIYLQKAERLLMDEMPIVPVCECSCRHMQSEDVDNLFVSHLGNIELRWARFKKESSPAIPLQKAPCNSLQKIRLYLQAEPLSFDPRIGGDRRSQNVIRELFEGLTRIGKDGRIELALAQSLSVSPNGGVYTFHLHPSQWSDGTELTADDFVWGWKSALDPLFLTNYSYGFFLIKNAKAARMGQCSLDEVGLRAVDSHTLEVELEVPAPYFLELLSTPLFSPICRRAVLQSPGPHAHLISNGPFVMKEHLPRSHIILERNPLYRNSENLRSAQLTFTIIEDPQEAYDRFQAGELDWYGDPWGTMALHHVAHLERQGLLLKKQAGAIFWLNCQTNIPHLRSVKIRRAIASAIHRKEICDTLLHCGESPAFSLLPQSMSLLEKPCFEENPASARQLFTEGLVDLGYTKESFPPLIIRYWSDLTTTAVVQKIQQQLQHVLGIRVELVSLDWKDYMKNFGEGDYQIQTCVWFSWYDDPMYNLQYVKYKDSGLNGTGWEEREYINLLNLVDTAESADLRRRYIRKAEEFVMNDLPLIPIFYRTQVYAKSPHLSGEVLSPAGTFEIQWLFNH